MAKSNKARTDMDVKSQMFSIIKEIDTPVCSCHTSVAASPFKCQAICSLTFEMLNKKMQIGRDVKNRTSTTKI